MLIKNYKIFLLPGLFLLLSIFVFLTPSYKCIESKNMINREVDINKNSYKFRKAVFAIMAFKNNTKYMEEIKENPGRARRLFKYILNIFYNPGANKKYEEAIKKRTVDSIKAKKN